jgi:multiple sugar transport system ATP-binding protein
MWRDIKMASVKLDNLYKSYGNVEAVRNMSLSVKDGEFMAFLGPSGCGKSSTMRMIAGLEDISGGAILFDDEPVHNMRPRDRNVAMAFENYALYPTLTVYNNLAFPLQAAKKNKAEIDIKVCEVAEIVGVTSFLNRKPGELSSGQAQMVGLARALMRTPSVFLLDEPISHLDSRQRSSMRAYLKKLHLDLGYTMIYVTHDQEEAMALSDRIAVMSNGVINQVGTPEEVYNNPVDLFVAGFIGEPPMNFLECRVTSDAGGSLSFDGLSLPIPSHLKGLVQPEKISEQVVLGIRPFYIDISNEKSESHGIPGEVFICEPLGDSTVVSVDVANTRIQIVSAPDYVAKPKDKIWLHLDSKHMLLFNTDTGKAVAD